MADTTACKGRSRPPVLPKLEAQCPKLEPIIRCQKAVFRHLSLRCACRLVRLPPLRQLPPFALVGRFLLLAGGGLSVSIGKQQGVRHVIAAAGRDLLLHQHVGPAEGSQNRVDQVLSVTPSFGL